jgi:hypothetical protein
MSQKGKVVRKSSTQKITIDSAVLDLLFWRFTDHHLRTSAAGALLRRTFRVSMGQNEIVAPKKAIKYSYFLGYIMLYPHFRLCIIWWGIFYLGPKFANFRGTQFLKSEKNMCHCVILWLDKGLELLNESMVCMVCQFVDLLLQVELWVESLVWFPSSYV